jgi:threonine dehydratase
MIPYSWLEEADKRISTYIHETPLIYDSHLQVYIKWENHQQTGSFKARGALNKVLGLQEWECQVGLVAASAGNHGQGVALAGKIVRAPVTVFVSENAVPAKVQAMQSLGAKVQMVPGGYSQAEAAGKAYASDHHLTWISPYNDGQVIAGQATLGLEILRQEPSLSRASWVVPVSGGGLISGIGAALKGQGDPHTDVGPRPYLFGVQTVASAFFHAIFYHGSQEGIQELPSLADGLAGPVEDGSITIPIVKEFVDEILLVDEEQIVQAVAYAWDHHHERIEGSAAAALAAVLSGDIASRPAVVIISGGNIQPEVHSAIIQGQRYIEP